MEFDWRNRFSSIIDSIPIGRHTFSVQEFCNFVFAYCFVVGLNHLFNRHWVSPRFRSIVDNNNIIIEKATLPYHLECECVCEKDDEVHIHFIDFFSNQTKRNYLFYGLGNVEWSQNKIKRSETHKRNKSKLAQLANCKRWTETEIVDYCYPHRNFINILWARSFIEWITKK